jgi:hypothetical protein
MMATFKSLQFEIRYDPALLQITSAQTGSDLRALRWTPEP